MIFSDEEIFAGLNLIIEAMRSPNYVVGVSGWSINKDGSIEANSVVLRGGGTTTAVEVGTAPNPQIQIGSNANVGVIKFLTNRAIESNKATVLCGPVNTGLANEYAALVFTGPSVTGAGDYIRYQLSSQNNDATSNANAQWTVQPANTFLMALDKTKLNVFNNRFTVQSTGKTDVSNLDTAVTGLSVNNATGHVSHLLDLNVNSVNKFWVDFDGSAHSAAGAIFAGAVGSSNMDSGLIGITTTAGTWVEVAVTFNKTFASNPVVTASPNNQGPAVGGTTTLEVAVTQITTVGCTIRVLRSTISTMTVGWIAHLSV